MTIGTLAIMNSLHGEQARSPQRSMPPSRFGFLGCAEPSPTAALIHFNFGVSVLVLRVINPLAFAVDVSLNCAFG
jgi:hypothetical protein